MAAPECAHGKTELFGLARINPIEHQHLALGEIHRITGQQQLFDTLFVFENFPIETGIDIGVPGDDGLVIEDLASRETTHYPLVVQASPGRELSLRVEFRSDMFDEATIEMLRVPPEPAPHRSMVAFMASVTTGFCPWPR